MDTIFYTIIQLMFPSFIPASWVPVDPEEGFTTREVGYGQQGVGTPTLLQKGKSTCHID